MGGDRDGNPFVTPEATRDTLQLHRELARELLRTHIREAYVVLSQEGDGEETVRAELQALGDAVREQQPVALVERLDALDARLRARGPGAQRRPAARAAAHGGPVFGRHLVSLDLREHSALTGAAVAELLAGAGVAADYLGLSEPDKLAVLVASCARGGRCGPPGMRSASRSSARSGRSARSRGQSRRSGRGRSGGTS
jgi:phosphoenolpyruvate carboxylase